MIKYSPKVKLLEDIINNFLLFANKDMYMYTLINLGKSGRFT